MTTPPLLERIVDTFPHSLVVTDIDADIVYVNRRFTELTGYEREEVLGQNPRILSSGQTLSGTYATMWQTITRGEVWSSEIIDRKRIGELYWARLTVFPLFDSEGQITHYVGHQVDITEEKIGPIANEVGRRARFQDRQLNVGQLRPGMVLRDDVRTNAGVVLLRAGHVIDALLLRRLVKSHSSSGIVEPLRVDVPRP